MVTPVSDDIRRGLIDLIELAVDDGVAVTFGEFQPPGPKVEGLVWVGDIAARFSPSRFRSASDKRYEVMWDVDIVITSSHRASAASAYTVAWEIARQVTNGFVSAPNLGSTDVSKVEPVGIQTLAEWDQTNRRVQLLFEARVTTYGMVGGGYTTLELVGSRDDDEDTPAPSAPAADGAPGARGRRGRRGLDGLDGPRGAQGIQGVAGVPGAPGAPGAAGARGRRGRRGLDGVDGMDGTGGGGGGGSSFLPPPDDVATAESVFFQGWEDTGSGSWRIRRIVRATGVGTDATGSTDYSTNWTGRASLTYA